MDRVCAPVAAAQSGSDSILLSRASCGEPGGSPGTFSFWWEKVRARGSFAGTLWHETPAPGCDRAHLRNPSR